MPRFQTPGRDWVQLGLGVLALGLASCAVVPPQGTAGQEAAGQDMQSQGALAVLAQPECRRMASQRARLQAVHAALAREGMGLRVLGCPQLPAGKAAGAQVIAVAVLVVDGERAADTVRGPLADGELLDMGSAAPQAASGPLQRVSTAALAQPPRDSLSPDVLYNRAWLRRLMAAQGLRQVADTWWAFAPR
ncbi:hypothetical protein [Comamonas endophytica]|uniref:D-Ala-D-Ala dipeptidase n=1 Tax=Comamonas endophytica TaxID=2949090 RepID=A0ABY6G6K1_9BURK|nr:MULTISPECIES: hypothetical protein [unclassified Acidovorax]MCD2511255.1 hypothetical protein [Acidovorax sp. D4N7]UYG50651.1 hypothetical protein M9799_11155 [Acidovorax sp. 5MLIR]